MAERLVVLPPIRATNGSISMPTSREYSTKIEHRRIVARQGALCVQYPDKYVFLVQPHVPDDPPDDLTVPQTAG